MQNSLLADCFAGGTMSFAAFKIYELEVEGNFFLGGYRNAERLSPVQMHHLAWLLGCPAQIGSQGRTAGTHCQPRQVTSLCHMCSCLVSEPKERVASLHVLHQKDMNMLLSLLQFTAIQGWLPRGCCHMSLGTLRITASAYDSSMIFD